MNYYFNLNNCNYIDFFNYKVKLLDFRNFDYFLRFNLFKYLSKCNYLQIFKLKVFNNIKVSIFLKKLLTFNFNNTYKELFNNNITDIDRIDANDNLFILDFINMGASINVKHFEESFFIKYYLNLYGNFNNIIFLPKISTRSGLYNILIDIYNIIDLFIKDNKIICSLYYDNIDKIVISGESIGTNYNENSYLNLVFNNYYNNNFINYFIYNKNIINKINNIDIFNKFIINDLLSAYGNNFLNINNINFSKNIHKFKIYKLYTNIVFSGLNYNNINNIFNIFKKTKKFEEYISNFIFGQEKQLYKLSTIDINKVFSNKLTSNIKPIGSWIICGPSGVGKTEVAKVISKLLYNDKSKFIKFDMSEFMDKYTISRLIGAPPGYLGYEKGGELTNLISNNPNSVILFDEAEKAHKHIYDLLLQVLDEGVLTDSKGIKVFFNKSVLMFTSNIGADLCKNSTIVDTNSIINELRKFFRIEFLNRLDNIVVFNYLDLFSIYKIMDKFFYNIRKLCMNDIKIKLILSIIFNKNNTNIRKIIKILENNIINKICNTIEGNDIILDICNKSLIYKIL